LNDLEKILSEIDDAASKEADEIIAKAKAGAEEILGDARDEAAKQATVIGAGAEDKVSEYKHAGESARQLYRRKRVLETKQELILSVVEKAKEHLSAMPDNRYFELLTNLAVSAAVNGDGLVLLNEKDKNRLPKDFEDILSKKLPREASLRVSIETRPIDGGLILKYGGVEQNCSFEAIFNARRDEFSDIIRDILFT
jgi:V/A-type H+-transporting ATPase subunit E